MCQHVGFLMDFNQKNWLYYLASGALFYFRYHLFSDHSDVPLILPFPYFRVTYDVLFCSFQNTQTPSQQSNILDNGQEDLSLNQWNPYPLGRRDVPPETVAKKVYKGPWVGLWIQHTIDHKPLTNVNLGRGLW